MEINQFVLAAVTGGKIILRDCCSFFRGFGIIL